MRFPILLGLASTALVAAHAVAQMPPPPADVEPAPPAARSRMAKKPANPKPPASITVANASQHTALKVVITSEQNSATYNKPLRPKARTVMKLPKIVGCTVSVAADFEGEGEVEIGEFDVCKDKIIRFTD